MWTGGYLVRRAAIDSYYGNADTDDGARIDARTEMNKYRKLREPRAAD